MPNSQASQQLCSGTKITWEELNQYVIQAQAAILVLSGLLILLNKKCTGGLLLMISSIMILFVKDYPWLRHSSLKSIQRERNERLGDFLKNLVLLGASFILMQDKSKATSNCWSSCNPAVVPAAPQ